MVTGIVLAAGRSERMGRAKALLDVRGRSFLAAAVGALRGGGCEVVFAVVRAGAIAVAREAERAGAKVVWNRESEGEQVDSLRLGLVEAAAVKAGPGGAVTAAVVLPVDHPLVRGETVRRLVAAHVASPAAVVRPVFEGRAGHPTLFPKSLWPILLSAPLPDGARTLVEADRTLRTDVPVDDPGVLVDIDTPARYRALTGDEP